jgi:predicted RNA methylase
MLVSQGEQKLSAAEYEKLMDIILPLQQENIKRLTDEVEHFTDKFDYRHKDEPWGTSRDSVERGILKTASEFIQE